MGTLNFWHLIILLVYLGAVEREQEHRMGFGPVMIISCSALARTKVLLHSFSFVAIQGNIVHTAFLVSLGMSQSEVLGK